MIYYDWINNQLEPGQQLPLYTNEFSHIRPAGSRPSGRGTELERGQYKCFAKIVRPRWCLNLYFIISPSKVMRSVVCFCPLVRFWALPGDSISLTMGIVGHLYRSRRRRRRRSEQARHSH